MGFGGGGAPPVNFHRPGTHGANTADRAGVDLPPQHAAVYRHERLG